MDRFKIIQNKLESFIRKYYTNELIKGTILFFAIGLLYFLLTLFVEYFLWLSTSARTVLFWLFVGVEGVLVIKFIVFPLAKLFKLKEGINYETASKIIGTHFTEVNDKLLNVLQLQKESSKTELLLASIEQKASELSPVPFKMAINFKRNLKYLKYALLPLGIIAIVFISGNFNLFSDSFSRVVHYNTAYEPPAPFQFYVINDTLKAVENTDFKLHVRISGQVIPDNVEIHFNNESYFLKQKQIGEFEYVFSQPKETVRFQLEANNIISKPYELKIVQAPSLESFEMRLTYPQYINKQTDVLKSTGNTSVPEGTQVTWLLHTKATDSIQLFSRDTLLFSKTDNNNFKLLKTLYSDFSYTLSTSNTNLKNYENLSFNIDVIKDEYPELNIRVEKDSIDLQTLYFYGQLSDDYGFSKLQLIYYPTEDESKKKYQKIPVSLSNISDFFAAFPDNMEIQKGVRYSLYFQVSDNDALHHYKSTRSNVFMYRKRTDDEEEQKKLDEQNETIKNLDNSLKKFDGQQKQLEELTKTQKEKQELNFNDKKKFESFLKRQKQQDEMMKNFNERLKNNLEEFQNETPKEDDPFKEALKERIKQNEEKLKQDEKLLNELEKLKDKIDSEQFSLKLEELAKQNKNKKRSLEQLLELTKRFYVGKKQEKLLQELTKLANKQNEMSNESEDQNTKEKQDSLNEDFNDFKKQLDELERDNKNLKKPFDIPRDKLEENDIETEQKRASEALDKLKNANTQDNMNSGSDKEQHLKNAKTSQKKAAKKMMQMSQKMQQSMQMGSGEQLQEDTEMLRAILDNLLLFSFEQEDLMDQFKRMEVNHSKYASYLRKQNTLKEHFKHIDDSLFALSLRQPKLSEKVNKEITEVYFNIDKALTQLADNQTQQGVSHQQFTITATNNLSNFLSDVLDNMEEQLSLSPGSGKGSLDMQLPDIIMNQEQLNKMMENGLKKGDDNKSKTSQDKEGRQGSGEGESDKMNKLLYQIYMRQQELRQALEDKLSKEGNKNSGNSILKKMEDVELDLLNKGFTNQTLQKMMELEHQLLKLENATFQQGEDNKRESETNFDNFNNDTKSLIQKAKQYFKTTEILNRQTLPLQHTYKIKVQEYFKKTND